jgi:RimJ/RimL family protein N-acetyltransferase
MLSGYLLATRMVNRLRLVIHTQNAASRRLAERCGYGREGTFRGAWFHQGRHHDVEVYALLREDAIAAGPA